MATNSDNQHDKERNDDLEAATDSVTDRGLGIAASAGGGMATSAHAAEPDGTPITIQSGCNEDEYVTVPGAVAEWTTSCSNGKMYISGTVEDTRSDGKCARVKASIASGAWQYSAAACPNDDIEDFAFSGNGSTAKILLYTYDV